MTLTTSGRREDIDALRIGATYLLFVFHTAMVFNPAPFYHIRNDELSFLMLIVCGFISLWHMPLFFLLAVHSCLGSSLLLLRERMDDEVDDGRLGNFVADALWMGVPMSVHRPENGGLEDETYCDLDVREQAHTPSLDPIAEVVL